MADIVFQPIPADLCQHVEPEAGEFLARSRHRRFDEFHPNWAHITSPGASVDAVVAALTQSSFDVEDRTWEAVLRQHAPAAMSYLDQCGARWADINEGRVPVEVLNQFARTVNEALGGYQVMRLFPVADILDAIDDTLDGGAIMFG